jgi:hypothetical protein
MAGKPEAWKAIRIPRKTFGNSVENISTAGYCVDWIQPALDRDQ